MTTPAKCDKHLFEDARGMCRACRRPFCEDCLVFTTGYAVNLGVISSLIGPDDRVVLDSSAHASMFDGASMTRGSVRIFRHNSPAALRRRLEAWRDQGQGGVLVGIDGVYSMEGDTAPVAEGAPSAELADSVRSLLGLNLVERLQADLDIYLAREIRREGNTAVEFDELCRGFTRVWWIRKRYVVLGGLEPLGEAQRITPVNRHAILHLQGLGIRLEGRE